VWLERLLLFGGAAALVWCAVFVADGLLAQRSARRALKSVTWSEAPRLAPASGEDSGIQSRAMSPPPGSAIASLSIPRLQLSAVVLQGADPQTLRRGPGHIEDTAFPGEPGNVAIAGHRDSFFWPLRNVRIGDDVFLETSNGPFHYRVTSVRVVPPRDVSVLAPTRDATLTLITCYPFWILGQAPDRFVVRATRVGMPAADPRDAGTPSTGGAGGTRVLPPSTPHAPARRTVRAIADDGAFVREAVDRYLLAYNSQVSREKGASADAFLRLDTCAVVVDGDRATATCATGVTSPADGEPQVRTFRLDRSAGGWSIRSVVLGRAS
jgi:sortase A